MKKKAGKGEGGRRESERRGRKEAEKVRKRAEVGKGRR